MTLANLLPWKRVKPADPMQTETQVEPRTEEALDKVAAKYKGRAELWQRAALNTETELFKVRAERDAARDELARLKASRERSNANLRRGSAPKADREAA